MRPGSVLLLALFGACFNPRYNDPTCGPGGECPAGLTCVAGVCRSGAPDDATIDNDSPDDAAIDTGMVTPDVLFMISFQQDVDGYTQCHDSYLDQDFPTALHGSDDGVRWRNETNKFKAGLLRFGNILGAGAIPTNATIISATLTIQMDQAGSSAMIAEAVVAWDEATVTYDNFGPSAGVQMDDVGQTVGPAPTTSGTHSIDVKASVERWRSNQIPNYGWIFVPASGGGSNDSQFRSSDDNNNGNHPLLSVAYSL